MLVIGEPGSGKSAFLSKWVKEREGTQKDEILISHFVGSSNQSRG